MSKNPTLKIRIIAAGLTQSDLAAQLGFSKRKMSVIANGLQQPTPAEWAAINAVLKFAESRKGADSGQDSKRPPGRRTTRP